MSYSITLSFMLFMLHHALLLGSLCLFRSDQKLLVGSNNTFHNHSRSPFSKTRRWRFRHTKAPTTAPTKAMTPKTIPKIASTEICALEAPRGPGSVVGAAGSVGKKVPDEEGAAPVLVLIIVGVADGGLIRL